MELRYFFALLAFVCASAAQAGPRDDLLEHLEKRAWDYHATYESEVDTANSLIGEFRSSLDNEEIYENVKARFDAAMDAVHAASLSKGRGELVNEYWAILDDKPSAMESELWLQSEASEIETDYRRLDQLASALKVAEASEDVEAVVRASQEWVTLHGELVGRVAELDLLSSNLASYYQAKGERDARRKAALSAFLGSMGRSLASQRAQFAPAPPNLTIHCKEYFSGTQCRTQ